MDPFVAVQESLSAEIVEIKEASNLVEVSFQKY